MRTTSFQCITLTVGVCLFGCSGTDNTAPPPGTGGEQSVGGSTGVGGNTSAVGGSLAAGGSAHVGGGANTGGAATGGSMAATGGNILGAGGATGGSPQTGGSKAAGGTQAAGGSKATGGVASTGGAATGGKAATGGAATGGAATGGKAATGGAATGGAATGGKAATGGAATGGAATGGAGTGGGSSTVNCSATMPTGGTTVNITSTTYTSGTADGLDYGGWTNGAGGTVTYFTNAHAFAASWSSTTSNDFLAHLGLDFNPVKTYPYGTIIAQFVETKTANPTPSYSMIGMYGWMHSPCVEWYINEDTFGTLSTSGTAVTIDGATYYLTTNTTTGTGGNACESGHTGGWVQMISTRSSKRQCGTITLSDHFAAWANQGWSLGSLASAYINVETGSGVGSIQFPIANVTAD